ncbi:uncharacterized protein K02A2.6-like [Achroia grisella]|uniref:uncharacterized protein K02A2.6-like n=1 Tax=Achroia grisella TaxID=688607 RepID=UPI0027D25675|nr:uncharacterized protein K02A2.6-like [Achroia grisella]
MATRTNTSQIKYFEEGDDIDCFLERMDQYMVAYAVEQTKQVSVLLMSLDEKTYKTLKSIFHPTLPKEKAYKELCEALKLRFRQRVSYYRTRTLFDKISKNDNENISTWYTRVREMAADCDFGKTFEDRVKDKFVTGIRFGPIFERLCEESTTRNVSELLEIALAKESVLQERQKSFVNKVQVVKKPQYSKISKYDPDKAKDSSKETILKCIHCGKSNHSFARCKYKTYKCKLCGKIGHLAAICKSKTTHTAHTVEMQDKEEENGSVSIFTMEMDTVPQLNYISPYSIECIIGSKAVKMEQDTGAAVSCIPDSVYNRCFTNFQCQAVNCELKTYNGEVVKPIGLGEIEGEIIKLELLDEKVKPVFHKPRPIPYAYKDKIDEELLKLEKEREETPLVPVMKENGQLRLCANYKITINKYLKDVNHPLPRIEDIFAALQGGDKFSKLDLRNAFNHLICDNETGNLLAWSTPRGIYRLNRLPYGTKPASAIFQAKLEKVLLGAKGVINFIDDTIVTGANDEEHLQNLEEVLRRFQKVGIRLNKSKCLFFEKEVKYLGHIISKEGLRKDNSKLNGIIYAPPPSTVTEVRAWIGSENVMADCMSRLPVSSFSENEINLKECDYINFVEQQNVIDLNMLDQNHQSQMSFHGQVVAIPMKEFMQIFLGLLMAK